MTEKFILGTADYAFIGVMLAISTAIGLYFRIFGGQQRTNEEYILAGKNMSIFPVSFSLMATFMSATTLMGIPAEMYLFGTNMTFMNLGFLIGPIICSFLFLPIYFNTGVTTSYEYLERRFGKTTRRILSGIFLFQNALFNGVVLYAPALALSAVTNLSVWTSVISIGVVCTFYCTMGGMKAVLWTDVFQAFLMFTCLLIIIIKGCLDLGGMKNIFKIADEGGRIVLPTFEADFSRRYTMWSIFLQGLIITCNSYGGSQIQVQRQLTLKNLKRSKIASLISAPMLVIFQLLCCLCGIIFYVYFKSCDPMSSPTKPIHSADQLMPYYITSAMKHYPGLPGLCIAGIFSASLSSLSSSINSMAAVTHEDVLRSFWPNISGSVLVTKFASIFYGALCIVMTFLAASMGNLVKASVLTVGMVSGPSLGVYLLAALTTTANEMGVNIGVVAAFILGGCLTFIPNARHYPELPVGVNCSGTDSLFSATKFTGTAFTSMNISETAVLTSTTNPYLPDNFPVSYMWISPLCMVVCIIVGYFSSWIISCFRDNSKPVSSDLLSPIMHRWLFKNEIKEDRLKKQKNFPDVSDSKF